MKLKFILSVAILTAFVCLYSPQTAHSNSTQPPIGNTGAPGHSSCGGGNCHGNSPNSGSGNVSISFVGDPSSYTPGMVYDINVTITDPDAARYGFEMCTWDDVNVSQGEFAGDAANNINVRTSGTTQYVNHQNVPIGNSNVFTVSWTAPAAGTGAMTFYVAANAANGANGAGGDNIYTSSFEIEEGDASGIELEASNSFTEKIIFSLEGRQLTIDSAMNLENASLQIIDMSGRQIQTYSVYPGELIDVSTIPGGFYLFRIATEQGASARKIQLN